jgi:hypothetical protein
MRALPLVALCAFTAATAAGCARRPDPAARTALDCPVHAGRLNRVSVAADGRDCRYADALGDELELRLLPVAGGPEAALQAIEQALQAQFPQTGAAKARTDADDDGDEDGSGAASAKGGDHTDIALPGVHITTDAGKAEVQVGGVHVDAQGSTAVVREAHDAKMIGNPFVLERRGYKASYMLAREAPADGFVLVGYKAGGPAKGPLTVAVVKAKGHENGVFAQGEKLVRRNGGV